MPEGPEIRRATDRLHAALARRVATKVQFAFEELRPFENELQGVEVESVRPRGKAVLTSFANGRVIYSHNQLYGRWMIRKPDDLPDTGRQLRLAIHNDARWALLYSASDIEVLDGDRLHEHPFLARLGPDVLDEETTIDKLVQRLEDKRFQGRGLGGLLLDQGFVAGLGNYLRTEILFLAGLDPRARPKELDSPTRRLLAHHLLATTQQAYDTGGITNDLDRVAELKARGQRRGAYRHWTFGRAGRPCYRCGTPIEKITAASRRLYRCPECQPLKS